MRAFSIVAAAALLLISSSDSGGQPCGSLQDVATALDQTYQEQVVAGGAANDGTNYLVFASAGGATWTMVIANSHGVACLVDAGHDWKAVATGEAL